MMAHGKTNSPSLLFGFTFVYTQHIKKTQNRIKPHDHSYSCYASTFKNVFTD